jgi:hypothetical protein
MYKILGLHDGDYEFGLLPSNNFLLLLYFFCTEDGGEMNKHLRNCIRPYTPFVGPWPLFQFSLSYTQLVRLLARGISPSQGRYLHTGQHKCRINANKHPCAQWDSNTRSRCGSRRRLHALDRVATLIGIYLTTICSKFKLFVGRNQLTHVIMI